MSPTAKRDCWHHFGKLTRSLQTEENIFLRIGKVNFHLEAEHFFGSTHTNRGWVFLFVWVFFFSTPNILDTQWWGWSLEQRNPHFASFAIPVWTYTSLSLWCVSKEKWQFWSSNKEHMLVYLTTTCNSLKSSMFLEQSKLILVIKSYAIQRYKNLCYITFNSILLQQ